MIYCPTYTGPQFFRETERVNWVPINIHTVYSANVNANRSQMPFRLAYAITVHKSQGATLESGVIDFTDSERSLGSSYVQLTRFKHINSFLVMPFPYSRITSSIKKSSCLKARTQEEERLSNLVKKTLNDFSALLDLINKE